MRTLLLALSLSAACVGLSSAVAAGASPSTAPAVETLKIVSDLPLSGYDSARTAQMVRAIRFVLQQAGYRAGGYRIRFESHTDSTAAAKGYDRARCAANARGYAADRTIVGVVGPFDSGCAERALPILNQAGLALISPSNTYAGVSKAVPGTDPDEPAKYYPTGTRTYFRVIASDDNQARIGASYLKGVLGAKRVYVLDDDHWYGRSVAYGFEAAARRAGLAVVGHAAWDEDHHDYTGLMEKIRATRADAIYVGGDVASNGGRLLRDKVAILGDAKAVKVLVADGFVYESLFEEAGFRNVEGVVGMIPTLPLGRLTGSAREFERAFAAAEHGKFVSMYALYAAAATQALLDAIARSDGSRADVVAKLAATSLPRTAVGPLAFDGNGDPRHPTEYLYKAKRGSWVFVGARSRTSDVRHVKPVSPAAATSPTAAKGHDATYAPSLKAGTRFTGASMRHVVLSNVAYSLSKLMGRPVRVNVACWSKLDWFGLARDGDSEYTTDGFWWSKMPHWVHLSPEICRSMETLMHNRPQYPNVYTAEAVVTLTHEMIHAIGIEREALTECFAMQASAGVAGLLGVPEHYALRLAHLSLENYGEKPPSYIDRTHCREGGTWDILPEEDSPPWHGA
jgi:branched-chain amino acid transport system substrate-binding protein